MARQSYYGSVRTSCVLTHGAAVPAAPMTIDTHTIEEVTIETSGLPWRKSSHIAVSMRDGTSVMVVAEASPTSVASAFGAIS